MVVVTCITTKAERRDTLMIVGVAAEETAKIKIVITEEVISTPTPRHTVVVWWCGTAGA